MKLEDVLKLKEAGFTAEEISTLAPSIKEDVVITPASKAQTEKVESPDYNGLNAKIDKLAEQIQALAIRNTTVEAPQDVTLPDIAKSILGGK